MRLGARIALPLSGANNAMKGGHPGGGQPMDTMRDKQYLEELWASGKAPWKNWR